MVKCYIPKSTLCDPPDFNNVLARPGTVKDAWREYASRATRPYTYETFRWRYMQWFAARKAAGECSAPETLHPVQPTGDEFVTSEQYWHSQFSPKARVLVLRNGASVRVRNGSLETIEELPLHLSPDGAPNVITFSGTEARRGRKLAASMMPKTIVLPEHGWFVTAEAVKFCLQHKIALVSVAARSSQGELGLLTVVAGDAVSNAALVRQQVAADPVRVAREIVRQKVLTCARLERLGHAQAKGHIAALDKAKTVNQIMLVEASAASTYWEMRRCPIRSSSRRWPKDWQRFVVRKSWIGAGSPRHADHPVNALLNWAYAVHAGRLATELMGRGAYLGIGYLHADKQGRYSLVYDALELLRPLIDERVFRFLCGAVFRMGDFAETPAGPHRGEVRVSQELLKAFAPAASLPQADIERVAEWVEETLLGSPRERIRHADAKDRSERNFVHHDSRRRAASSRRA